MIDLEKLVRDKQDRLRGRPEDWIDRLHAWRLRIDWITLWIIGAGILTLLMLLLALGFPAEAQSIPKSEPLMNQKGDVIGTATVSGNRTYFRDAEGKLLYTMEKTEQGMAMYDPNGKRVDFKLGEPAKESRH